MANLSGSFSGSIEALDYSGIEVYSGSTFGFFLHQRLGTDAERVDVAEFYKTFLESDPFELYTSPSGGRDPGHYIIIRSGSDAIRTAPLKDFFGGYTERVNINNRHTHFLYSKGVGRNSNVNQETWGVKLLTLNGETIYDYWNSPGRLSGLTLTILDGGNFDVISTTNYNTSVNIADANNLASALDNITPQEVGILTSLGYWETNVTDTLRSSSLDVGLTKLAAFKGPQSGSAYTAVFTGASGSNANKDVVEKMSVVGIGTGSKDIPVATLALRLQTNKQNEYGFPIIDGATSTNALYAFGAGASEDPVLWVDSNGNIVGDITVQSASFATTASYAANAGGVSASYATTASHAIIANTASYIDGNANFSDGLLVTGSITASQDVSASAFIGDGSQITGVISSSYATTASYAANAGTGTGTGIFNQTGSYYATSNDLQVTGSFDVSGSGSFEHINIIDTTTINGITYYWPGSSGADQQVLTTDGAGNLAWTAKVSGSVDSASFAETASYASNVPYVNITNKPSLVSASSQIDHDQTTNYAAAEHFLQSAITTVGTVTSGDVSSILPLGTVSSSGQVDYTGLSNIPSGIVSSSGQVDHDQTTNYAAAEHYLQSAITEVGTVTTGDVSAILPVGTVSASGQIDHDQTTNYNAAEHFIQSNITTVGTVTVGDISSILPVGTVSSSGQIDHDQTTNFNSAEHYLQSAITEVGTVTTGDISAILPSGLVSSSAFSAPSQGTLRATLNGVNEDTDLGLQTGDSPTFNGLTLSNPLPVTSGGTGNVNWNTGSILYSPDATSLSHIEGTEGQFLSISGVGQPQFRDIVEADISDLGPYLSATGDGVVSQSIQIDHDQTTNYAPAEHFLQSEITQLGTVVSGDITGILPSGTISGSGQVDGTAIQNNTVNFGGVSVALGGSDTTPAFNLTDASNYPSNNIDHDATTNFSPAEHFIQSAITTVGTVTSGNVDAILPSGLVSQSIQVDHDQTTNYAPAEHFLQSEITQLGTVVSGDITGVLPSGTVSGSGQVDGTAIQNNTVNFGGVSVALGGSDTTPALNLTDASNYPSSNINHDATTNFSPAEHFTQANITTVGTVTSGNVDAILPTGLVSQSIQIDHDQTTNYAPAEHFTQANITQLGTVVSGDITGVLPSGTVSASSQVNGTAIQNNTVNFGGVSVALGGSDTTPAFNLTDASNYPSNNIDHDATTNYSPAEHFIQSAITTVGTVTTGDVSAILPTGLVSQSIQIDHDQTTNYAPGEHFLQSEITQLGTVVSGDISAIIPANVLTTADEGPGNGLDADTLDSQQGTYYLNLANHTGTLPADQGGTGYSAYTAGDIIYAQDGTSFIRLGIGGHSAGDVLTISNTSPATLDWQTPASGLPTGTTNGAFVQYITGTGDWVESAWSLPGTSGTTSQWLRGDGTWQLLSVDAADVNAGTFSGTFTVTGELRMTSNDKIADTTYPSNNFLYLHKDDTLDANAVLLSSIDSVNVIIDSNAGSTDYFRVMSESPDPDTATSRFYVSSDGDARVYRYLGVNGQTGDATYNLDVGGNTRATGTAYAADHVDTSHRKWKEEIKDWDLMKDSYMSLKPRQWLWNGKDGVGIPGTKGYGFVTDEVDSVFTTENMEAIYHNRISTQTVMMVQEHEKELESVKQERDELRNRVELLEQKMEKLLNE